jgi:invasion protein IalB
MKPIGRKLLWAGLGVAVIAGGVLTGVPLFIDKAPAADHPPAATAKKSDDKTDPNNPPLWGKSCAQGPEGKQACFVYQTAVQQPQNIQLLEVQIGYLGPDGKPRLIVTIPLGTLLPVGVAIKIDDHPEFTAPVQTCVAAGCRVILDMDQASFDDLRKGKQASMRFVTLQRQAIEVPVKLTGLATALTALKQ